MAMWLKDEPFSLVRSVDARLATWTSRRPKLQWMLWAYLRSVYLKLFKIESGHGNTGPAGEPAYRSGLDRPRDRRPRQRAFARGDAVIKPAALGPSRRTAVSSTGASRGREGRKVGIKDGGRYSDPKRFLTPVVLRAPRAGCRSSCLLAVADRRSVGMRRGRLDYPYVPESGRSSGSFVEALEPGFSRV